MISAIGMMSFFSCKKSGNNATHEAPHSSQAAPPPSDGTVPDDEYIDLSSDNNFIEMITVDSTLNALMSSSFVTSDNYDDFTIALNSATTESEVYGILASYGIQADAFIEMSNLKIDLLSGILDTYVEFKDDDELLRNSIYYSYEAYFFNNSSGFTKVGCIDIYNRARASCHRAYTVEVVGSMIVGALTGPVGGAVALLNIAKATYLLNHCLKDAWANYLDC